MKRRRGGARRSSAPKKGRSFDGSPLQRGTRNLLLALVAISVGVGGGYLYATQVVFPDDSGDPAEFRSVPDLRGLSLDEVRRLLEGNELAVGMVDSIRHPDVQPGGIIGQTPLPGQLAVEGGEVAVTVSLGPERRPVPDVARLQADRALTVLEWTGFQVLVDSIEADVPAGRVVETRPRAGVEVTIPAEIELIVSLGPPLVELPDLSGVQEERAREILEELGLEVGEVETAFRFGFSQGQVLEQHPAAGEMVPRGSAVRLVIGRRGFFRDGGADTGGLP